MTTANRLAGSFPARQGGRSGAMSRGDRREEHAPTGTHGLASFLGWFSIGLGLTEVLIPGDLARAIGMKDTAANRNLLRFYGLRELAAGVGILSTPRPAGWVWARVAGDAVDLATLGKALAESDEPERALGAMVAVAGVTALDIYDAVALGRESGPHQGGMRDWGTIDVKSSITIRKSPAELYAFWRDFANLPRFMRHLKSVEVLGGDRSRWTAEAPLVGSISWEAMVTGDQPDREINWRSVPGSHVEASGSVRFVPAPGDRGTEVHVEMKVHPPGGALGVAVSKLFGESPDQQTHDDLRIFKEMMETGEAILSEGSFDGTRLRQHPAQPPEHVPAEAMRG
jgi:uncharacterized membrane protein